MKKKLLSLIFIVVLSTVTLVDLGYFVWKRMQSQSFASEKTIRLDETEQTEMEVHLSGLCPGDSTSYTLHLKAREGEDFSVLMSFDKSGASNLAPFVDVEICLQGEKIDGGKLSEYLNGKIVTFPTRFDGGSQIDVEISYSMGLEVGDEAQNTTADFSIVLSKQE